jgi:anti-sigma factor RsiW
MPEIRDCGADAAAYALGALDPAEADAFREHLESCVVCAEELPAFQQVATLLSMGAPERSAPRALRRRVLRAVREEPRGSAAPASKPLPRRVLWWGSLPRPALALGVLLLLILVVGTGSALLSLNRASSSRVIQARVVDSTGSAQLRVTGGQAKLVVNNLPPPPAGLIYEVWLQRGHDAPSPTSALFSVTSNGAGDIDVPGDLHGVRQVTVTQEPADGSRVPTHAPVIIARLS